MIGYILAYLLGFLMILGGSRDHSDILDALATDTYWQLKQVTPSLAQLKSDAGPDAPAQGVDKLLKDLESPDFPVRDAAEKQLTDMGPAILPQLAPAAKSSDAQVAAVAANLIQQFTEHQQERGIRRLMAIRTLGERKEKDAVDLLNSIKDSKDLFVSFYAQRAIAQIQGTDLPALDISKNIAPDIDLLPADAALVGQVAGINAEKLSLLPLVDHHLNQIPGQAAAPDLKFKNAYSLQVSRQLLTLLEQVGNIRFDGVSVGLNLTKDQNDEKGWVVIVLHGEFDRSHLFASLKAHDGGNIIATPAEKPGDVATLAEKGGDTSILFPDDHRIILIEGTDTKAVQQMVLASLKSATTNLAANTTLAPLLKNVDTHAPAWFVAKLTPAMATDTLENFSTLTLTSKPTKSGTQFTFNGQATDAAKAKAAADAMTAQLATPVGGPGAPPEMKPVNDLVASIKVSADGPNVTLTGELKSDFLAFILAEMGPDIIESLSPMPDPTPGLTPVPNIPSP